MSCHALFGLQPASVFRFFEEMSAIPHGSGNTGAVSDWAAAFAREKGLAFRQDEAGNVVIWKDASPGYEGHPTVILQGHLDMVCVSDAGVAHDFTKDPLQLYIDGDWIKARGTTLGGDDGIAVAMAMAVLDDDTLPHPPLEVLLTTGEEIGLLGAVALDCSDLKGRILLNLDSEEEGLLIAGCAGGARCDISGSCAEETACGTVCTLRVHGLKGGHSGQEINNGLANADKLLGACLERLSAKTDLCLISLFGGLQDNAIPKEASARFVAADARELEEIAAAFAAEAKKQFSATEPALSVSLTKETGAEARALTPADSRRLIALLCEYPNGVLAMSRDIPGLVQTSLNLGILRLENGSYMLSSATRSSVSAEKAAMARQLQALAEKYGADFGKRGEYPAWEYRKDSPLRETMLRVFRQQYGKDAAVEAIHAGLECGLFADKLPGLDAVSFGPNVVEVHSTREKLSISSTQRTWQYLLAVLAAL